MTAQGFKTLDPAAINERRIGIGMLGYGFMGKVHSNAYLKIPYSFAAPAAYPELVAICGRNKERARDAAARLRYRGYYTDWKQMVKDPAIEIVDNVAPDDRHRAPSVAAAQEGKHIICEKPLGDDGARRRGHARCGSGSRGEEPLLLQLPLFPGRSPGQGTDR